MPELLKKRGLTQSRFAEMLGVSKGFISQVIHGKAFFSYELARKAAHILRCKMEDLHEWE